MNIERVKYFGQSSYVLFILIVLGCILPFSPFRWDNDQFIVVAALPFCYFAYLCCSKEQTQKIQFVSSDISWFIFLGISLFSYSWAIDGALVWNDFFNSAVLLLWMLMFRLISEEEQILQNFSRLLLGLFFFTIFQSFLFFIIYTTNEYVNATTIIKSIAGTLNLSLTNFLNKDIYRWHHFFGYNANVVALHILAFYPFLLFYTSNFRFFNLLKWAFGFWILFVIYKAGSQGVLLAFVLLLLYYIWVSFRPKHFFKIISFFSAFLLLLVYYLVSHQTSLFNESSTFYSLVNPGSLGNRVHPIINSIRVWLESPILGYGFGNWQLIAYQYDNLDLGTLFQAVDPLKGVINFRLLHSHNIYSKYLVELGIIGFLAFLYPFLSSLWKAHQKVTLLTNAQKAISALLIIYLTAAFFYRNANSFPLYFSRIQLIAFCSLGLLTLKDHRKCNFPKWAAIVCFALATSSLSWFIYSKVVTKNYKATTQLLIKSPSKALQEIEAIYHPVFKTTYNDGASLALKLAQLYTNQQDFNKADEYYSLALKAAPHNEEIRANYAAFLHKTGSNTSKAKNYALSVFSTNNRYQFDMFFVLAEIAILEKDYPQAQYYLNKRYHNYLNHPQRHRIMLIEKELYFGNDTYLDGLVDLTIEQKKAFKKLSVSFGIKDANPKAQLERFKYNSANNEKIRNDDVLMSRALSQILNREQFELYISNKNK